MLSVGELLRQQRQKNNISLQQIEKKIRVREKFLQAIENNQWEIFSSKVYIIGILKNYAKALGIEEEKVLAYFRRDYERRDDFRFKQRLSAEYFSPETRKVIFMVVAIIFIAFGVYFGFQVRAYLTPPTVTLISPQQTTFRNIEKITIRGKTEKEANIIIFGQRVYANNEGIFEYDLPLNKGANRLEIEVTGANGKKTILKRVLFLE